MRRWHFRLVHWMLQVSWPSPIQSAGPAHHHQLAFDGCISDYRRRVTGKHTWHRREIADIAVHHAEERAEVTDGPPLVRMVADF